METLSILFYEGMERKIAYHATFLLYLFTRSALALLSF
jgi:hypothetical protein